MPLPHPALTVPWELAIGDNTFMGWLITGAYLAASLACLLAAFRRPRAADPIVPWFWIGLFAALAFLAANKQLDLQNLLTDAGRELSWEQGWYDGRREIQRIFVLGLGGGILIFACFLFWRFRWEYKPLGLALVGIMFLLCFILVRAASFHHVDVFLKERIAGLRIRSFMELAGIALVIAGALSFRRRREE